jgi:hypothetical protein
LHPFQDEAAPPSKKPKLASPSAKMTVPEEFLDAITYEIMCQPIRLPCGLAVDALTLEKYYAEEAKFGRLPNDPFTGITFTEMFKPLSDAALKSRIDSFLTQNSDDHTLSNLPRTLGSTRSGNCRGNLVVRKQNLNSVSTAKSNRECPTTFTSSDFLDFDKFYGADFGQEEKLYPKLSTSPKATVSSLKTKPNVRSEDQMNFELLKILSGGSTYLTKNASKTKLEKKCKDCGLVLNLTHGISTFYIGLCDHVILCRICLSKTDKQSRKTCSQCGIEWRAKDCLRIYI